MGLPAIEPECHCLSGETCLVCACLCEACGEYWGGVDPVCPSCRADEAEADRIYGRDPAQEDRDEAAHQSSLSREAIS